MLKALQLELVIPGECGCLKVHSVATESRYTSAKCVHGMLPEQRKMTTSAMRRLTHRQKNVVFKIIQGLSNNEISNSLGIKSKTVKNHLNAIYRKFDVHDRFQLAQKASVQIYDTGEPT